MKWFTNFFKKLLKAIKKILAVVLAIIAVILILWSALATGGATLALFGFALSTTGAMIAGCVALVGAFLIDGKTAGKVVGKIGDAAGSAAGAVAGAVGSATGGAVTGLIGALLHNPVVLGVGLCVLGYYLLSGDEDERVNAQTPQEASKGTAEKRPPAEKKALSTQERQPVAPPTPFGMNLEA